MIPKLKGSGVFARLIYNNQGKAPQLKFPAPNPAVNAWASMTQARREWFSKQEFRNHESGFIKFFALYKLMCVNKTLKKAYDLGRISEERYNYLVNFPT